MRSFHVMGIMQIGILNMRVWCERETIYFRTKTFVKALVLIATIEKLSVHSYLL